MSITIRQKVQFRTTQSSGRHRKAVEESEAPKPTATSRLPRITRLMALAIRFDQLIRNGSVKDYAELARVGGVTRARVTQIMNLLNLAPDFQEAILNLPRVTDGCDPIAERKVRKVMTEASWEEQRRGWARVVSSDSGE